MFHESRFTDLLEAYFDQSLIKDERVEMEQALLASARSRELFWAHSRLHAAAREWGLAVTGDSMARTVIVPRWNWRPPLLAAAAAVVVGLGAWWMLEPARQPPGVQTLAPQPVALLAAVAEAEWSGAGTPPEAGSTLPPGLLKLARGVVRIDFFSGASALLAGPAEFELVSGSDVRLRSGRMHVHAPAAARGFTVRAGDVAVVDYGTDFGVAAEDDQVLEVQVFAGLVELRDKTASTRLTGGSGLRREGTSWRSQPVDRAAYPSGEQLDRVARGRRQSHYASWQDAARKFSASPGVLVHYTFDVLRDWPVLANAAPNGTRDTAASVIGCERVDGRWPEKSGLAFSRLSDRVRFAAPGEHQALTFMAWVRVDALPNDLNVLYRTDLWRSGYPHWNITQDGALRLGYHFFDAQSFPGPRGIGDWQVSDSPPVMRSHLGRWTHLATVIDMEARRLTHYMDGQPVSTHELKFPRPLRLGAGQLGNSGTGHPAPGGQNVNLVGCMDEFALVGRALAAEEIRQFYESGRP